MEAREIILTVAAMLGAGLVARLVSDLVRVPEMLLLLLAGIVIGPSALGWIDAPLDSEGAQVLLTLGVSFILFHGGLGLSVRVLSRTAVGLLLLVVPGVLLTALVTGAAAAALFDERLLVGLLIGAALAPTDPAILVPLFDRLRMRPKVAQTIVAESALNDPTGAVLALAIAAALVTGDGSLLGVGEEFLVDVGISLVLGVGFGVVLALVISSRISGVWRESAAIAVVAVVAIAYGTIDFAGGSGYLGAFVAGLIVGNMDEFRHTMAPRHQHEVEAVIRSLADVAVILVFVLLGADLPWDALRDEWLPALGVVAVLVLVARPLVVALCLLPDRRAQWSRSELLFLAWTRETGVVPAALAGILVAEQVDGAELVTVSVALALLVTVAVQTTTKPWLARRLALSDASSRA